MEGLTYAAIAKELGYSARGGAQMAVKGLVFEGKEEAIETAREVEAARYDALTRAVWKKAIAGDYAAIDRVLAISRERRRMLGLDEPTKVDWRIIAVEEGEKLGIPAAEAIAAAERIFKENGARV
jgi:hypothetical protein